MNDQLLALQVHLLVACWSARAGVSKRIEGWKDDDRGEVTATTALIVLLVIAAIAAGGVIARKIEANTNKIPNP